MKTVLLYFLLVFLILLLLLPPALRIFVPKEENIDEVAEGKNVTTMINCTKGDDETISFTYKNKKINQILYRVPGNKAYKGNSEELAAETNEIVKSLYKYGYPMYSEGNDITTFTVNLTTLESNDVLLKNYILPVSQEKSYIENLGFGCDVIDIEGDTE